MGGDAGSGVAEGVGGGEERWVESCVEALMMIGGDTEVDPGRRDEVLIQSISMMKDSIHIYAYLFDHQLIIVGII